MAHTKLHKVISGTVYILRPGQLFRALSPSSASHWLCVDFGRHWTPTRNHYRDFDIHWATSADGPVEISCICYSLLVLIIKSKISTRKFQENIPQYRACAWNCKKAHSVMRTVIIRLDHWLGHFKPGLGPNISKGTIHQASRFRKIIQKKECCWWNNARYNTHIILSFPISNICTHLYFKARQHSTYLFLK